MAGEEKKTSSYLIYFSGKYLQLISFLQSHTLKFEETGPILAKDAATKKDDWYANDISNPQNPINRRKRGEDGRRDKDKHRSRR